MYHVHIGMEYAWYGVYILHSHSGHSVCRTMHIRHIPPHSCQFSVDAILSLFFPFLLLSFLHFYLLFQKEEKIKLFAAHSHVRGMCSYDWDGSDGSATTHILHVPYIFHWHSCNAIRWRWLICIEFRLCQTVIDRKLIFLLLRYGCVLSMK